jgi:hypothetical protein
MLGMDRFETESRPLLELRLSILFGQPTGEISVLGLVYRGA